MTRTQFIEPIPLARSVDDAARAIGISRSFIYKLARLGSLRLTKIGNRTVILESELDRLLTNNEREPARLLAKP